jgi:hypothetical protein
MVTPRPATRGAMRQKSPAARRSFVRPLVAAATKNACAAFLGVCRRILRSIIACAVKVTKEGRLIV